MPYTSTDTEKEIANRALLSTWIQYYLRLGYKLFIYDRDGSNRDVISSIPMDTHEFGKTSNLSFNIIYHAFTIRGLLVPEFNEKYDNTEQQVTNISLAEVISRRARFESQGHDKVHTLTHCRFEAKALYGIDNIIVADFDEFLYCPGGNQSIQTQSSYQRKFISFHRRQGYDQITIPQRFLTNLTESPRDCLIKQAKIQKSIFEWYVFKYHIFNNVIFLIV